MSECEASAGKLALARVLRSLPARRAVMLLLLLLAAWPRRKWLMRYYALVESAGTKYRARTYFGSRILCDLRDSIGQRIFLFGRWEPSVSRGIESLLRRGDTFIDIGANIGYDTLLGAHRVGAEGHVVAIEASPRIVPLLRDNLRTNGCRNVRVIEEAVSDGSGTLQLYGGDQTNIGRTSTLHRAGLVPEDVVPARPLDALLTGEELRNARLIKIDIEGGEGAVLSRFVQTLDLYHPDVKLIVEMSPADGGDLLGSVFDRLIASGFRAYAIENVYDLLAYLPARVVWPPVEVRCLPEKQTDILFARGSL